MSSAVKNLPSSTLGLESYWARIKSIDGRHPLKHQVPEACIEYPVRYRAGGRVAYFNFELAKEITSQQLKPGKRRLANFISF
jgi:hypothetical protein